MQLNYNNLSLIVIILYKVYKKKIISKFMSSDK